MKKLYVILFMLAVISFLSFHANTGQSEYAHCYLQALNDFNDEQLALLDKIRSAEIDEDTSEEIRKQIHSARLKLKSIDIWLRYLEPVVYRKINGPLPVEWETEVFEKWEAPYRREGAGFTLAEIYLDEGQVEKEELVRLIESSIESTKTYFQDSITSRLAKPDHFFFANRMYLLNLAAIYTTGFECPNTGIVIQELKHMLPAVRDIYDCFNRSFPETPMTKKYLSKYDSMIAFINTQPDDFGKFDHFTFIKDHVNPLYGINQNLIKDYGAVSMNFNDYSLSYETSSIFDKSFADIQNIKGIFSPVEDEDDLQDIKRIGKLLFYDPIVSGNNQRSCVSCHNSFEYFTDTTVKTDFNFDREQRLSRNTPSLINAIYNHLLMSDGRLFTLQAQAKDVIANPDELASTEAEVIEKVLSCKEYRSAFKKLVRLTPEANELTMDHIVSAITFYYGSFSHYDSPFDNAMNDRQALDQESINGFNLFMSKAQCATCHFVPYFNGVKPPYTGSEFEVLGIPADTAFAELSSDSGRFDFHQAPEMFHAFRTVTVRNIQFTKPYMHNGVFNTLEEVIEFYDKGGGTGRGLHVPNQTLAADSLHLTENEKEALITFMKSLNEKVEFDEPPANLPVSSIDTLNSRKVGGIY